MNGKRTFWTGIIAGAVVGGIISLFNQDARNYGKHLVKESSDRLAYYTGNPDVTIKKLKQSVESIHTFVENNSKSAIDALDQVENSVQKFIK